MGIELLIFLEISFITFFPHMLSSYPKRYKLVSFDDKSLFTNVMKEKLIQSIDKRWEEIQEHTSIPKDEFLSIVSFIFENSYFKCNEKYYKQKSGSAMGRSPLFLQNSSWKRFCLNFNAD